MSCIIYNCTSKDKALFPFPGKISQINKWQQNMPFLDYEKVDIYQSFICEEHFKPEDILLNPDSSKSLNPDAAPSIFPSNGISTCRFCLKQIKEKEEVVTIDQEFKKHFQKFTDLEFNESQKLSKVSCRKCFEKILESSNFKTQLRTNQETLLRMFGIFNNLEDPNKFQNHHGSNRKENSNKKKKNEDPLVPVAIKIEETFDDPLDPVPSNSGTWSSFGNDDDDWEEDKLNDNSPDQIKKTDAFPSLKRKVIGCEICGKFFGRNSALKRHLLSHANERTFKCTQCEKAFNNLNNLKMHEKVHDTSNPVACPVCGEKFKHPNYLRNHLVSHNTEKKHECPICLKTFKRKYDVKKHSVIHNVTKSYKCDVCSKEFKRSDHLKSHKVAHSDERNFECSHCGKRFKDKGNLRQHVKTHFAPNSSHPITLTSINL